MTDRSTLKIHSYTPALTNCFTTNNVRKQTAQCPYKAELDTRYGAQKLYCDRLYHCFSASLLLQREFAFAAFPSPKPTARLNHRWQFIGIPLVLVVVAMPICFL